MDWAHISFYIVFILLAAIIALIQEAWARAHPRAMRPEEIARMNALLALGVAPRIADLLARGEKLQAIKAYREDYHADLREAVDAIKGIESALRADRTHGHPEM